MTTQYVRLAAVDKNVPLGAYVKGWKLAKANPDATFRHGLDTFDPTTGAEIVHQYRKGMHDRINTRGNVWSAYRPWLVASRRAGHREHLPAYMLVSLVLRRSRTFTVHEAGDELAWYFEDMLGRSIGPREAVQNVQTVIRSGWLALRDGVLVATRRGKRALSRRIIGQCAIH